MSDPVPYPSPDFECPPTNSFRLPSRSSFHASMWSWAESPTEPTRGPNSEVTWHHNAVTTSYHTQGHPNAQNFGRGRYNSGHRGGWHNHSPSGNHGKKNKNEPEYAFFCDTCDRGFKNSGKYGEHMAQHIKCSVPDCSFMAHEKIVGIHWKNNHAPGTKRIKLDTPEEIAKWREERRRNYPTLGNIEKKMKLMEEREVTGAVLDTAQFGRMRGRGRGRGRQWRHGRGGRGRQYQGLSLCNTAERPPMLPMPSTEGDPLGALVSDKQDMDKEEAAVACKASAVVVPPKQMSSALACLVTSYGSASESDDEPGASPLQRAQEAVQENQELLNTSAPQHRKLCQTPEMSSKVTCNGPKLQSPHANQRGGRGRGKWGRMSGRGNQTTPQERRPTLLEMLLASDVRHERNVLLQCVRFVVRNNFFRGGSEPQNGQTTPWSSDSPLKDSKQRCAEPSDVLPPHSLLTSGELTDIGTMDSEHSLGRTKFHTSEELGSEECDSNLSLTTPTYDDEIWESPLVT